MNTVQSYFQDAYRHQFAADVRSIQPTADGQGWNVVLTHSFFYPTSGGQPHDTGTLAGRPVSAVILDKKEGIVVHQITGERPAVKVGQTIKGEIDWARRFDHMQQHTGQHILSQAFIEIANAETVGFHLGDGSCTIDLAVKSIEQADVAAAEKLANHVISDNRLITSYFVTRAQAERLPLRKRPPVAGDWLRLVEIEEFDLNACGGTHVRRTGEVGLVKVGRLENRKDKVRVEFRCGRWAVAHFDRLQQAATQLTTAFTTSIEALPAAVIKLREEQKTIQKELRQAKKELLTNQAARLSRSFGQLDGTEVAMLVRCVDPTIDGNTLAQLAGELANHPGRAIFLGHPDGIFVLRKSADVPGHLGQLLQEALGQEPLGSGGGGPHFAQGSLPSGSSGRLLTFLSELEQKLTAQIREVHQA